MPIQIHLTAHYHVTKGGRIWEGDLDTCPGSRMVYNIECECEWQELHALPYSILHVGLSAM